MWQNYVSIWIKITCNKEKQANREINIYYFFVKFQEVQILVQIYLMPTMSSGDESNKLTPDIKPWSWRRSFTQITTSQGDEGSKWPTNFASRNDKSKSGFKIEEWSSKRRSIQSRSSMSKKNNIRLEKGVAVAILSELMMTTDLFVSILLLSFVLSGKTIQIIS